MFVFFHFSVKLLIACLPKKGNSILYLQTSNEDNGFAICHIDYHKIPQCSLQHEFGPEDSPIFLWTVGEEIHLTGNWIWDRNEDEEDYSEDNDEDCKHNQEHEHSHENENENDEVGEENEAIQKENIKESKKQKKNKDNNNSNSNQQEDEDKQTSNKRSRDFQTVASDNTTTTSTSSSENIQQPKNKKNKKKKIDNQIIPSSQIVVVSRPPADKKNSRPVWNVTPLNNEGLLIPDPKQNTLSSGVLITDYVIGHSGIPKLGSYISIIYEGLFPDGRRFDAQLDRKNPLTFRKGAGQVELN